jgi:hypothetical protein
MPQEYKLACRKIFKKYALEDSSNEKGAKNLDSKQ